MPCSPRPCSSAPLHLSISEILNLFKTWYMKGFQAWSGDLPSQGVSCPTVPTIVFFLFIKSAINYIKIPACSHTIFQIHKNDDAKVAAIMDSLVCIGTLLFYTSPIYIESRFIIYMQVYILIHILRMCHSHTHTHTHTHMHIISPSYIHFYFNFLVLFWWC